MSALSIFARKSLVTLTFASISWNALAVDVQASLPERLSTVKAGTNPVVLLGHKRQLGDKAPEFKVVDASFKKVSLADYTGKTVMNSEIGRAHV